VRAPLIAVILAVTGTSAATEVPPSAAEPTSLPSVPAAPSPPAPPPSLPGATIPGATILRTAIAVEPGQRLALSPGTELVIDPQTTFEIELSARAADARLVLVDGREDLVPAQDARELSSGTRLTLSPAVRLVPGSRYTLRLDGAVQRELHDEAGRAFSAVTFPLLVAGTPPPPEPKRPARKKKRR